MNNVKTEITWSQGIKISQDQQQQQSEKLEEFLESQCDLFSSHDWHYYAEVTGKGIAWLKENATFSDPKGPLGAMLENAVIDNDYDLVEMFCL